MGEQQKERYRVALTSMVREGGGDRALFSFSVSIIHVKVYFKQENDLSKMTCQPLLDRTRWPDQKPGSPLPSGKQGRVHPAESQPYQLWAELDARKGGNGTFMIKLGFRVILVSVGLKILPSTGSKKVLIGDELGMASVLGQD